MHDVLATLTAAPVGALLTLLAGGTLGVMFYAGLWWTVSRTATFRRPALSVLASLLLRMGVALTGFYFVARGDWARLLLCLAGFALARAAVTWFTRLPPAAIGPARVATEARHAP